MEKKTNWANLDQYRVAANEGWNPLQCLKDKQFFAFEDQDYQNIQLHSTLVDQILDIPVDQAELSLRERARAARPGGTIESWSKELHDGVMTWVGLNPAQLQTPYKELYDLLRRLNPAPGDRIVDIGAGYGRMGIILGQLWPQTMFIGHEMVNERVEIGNAAYARLGIKNGCLEEKNVAEENYALPCASLYFIYDFGSLPDMKKLLSKLALLADEKKSFKVVARGRGINSLIQETEPWLTVEAQAFGNSVIYQNNG